MNSFVDEIIASDEATERERMRAERDKYFAAVCYYMSDAEAAVDRINKHLTHCGSAEMSTTEEKIIRRAVAS